MQRPIILSILALFLFLSTATAQEEIKLINPSFEGMPTLSKGPRGWVDCGFPGESAPDVHPVPSSDFGVTQEAMDGKTYLGMVVRDNDTWEAVSQYLSSPFQADSVYSFSIYLARSTMYLSRSRKTNTPANYTTPAILRVWGGNGACDKAELLAETPEIIDALWMKYGIVFSPSKAYTYITLETYYTVPVLSPYNGNLLLDNCSPIELLSGRTIDPTERIQIEASQIRALSLMERDKKDKLKEDTEIERLQKAIVECRENLKDKDMLFIKESIDFEETLLEEGLLSYLTATKKKEIKKQARDLLRFDNKILNKIQKVLLEAIEATPEQQTGLVLKHQATIQKVKKKRLIEKEVLAFIEWNKGKLIEALENCKE